MSRRLFRIVGVVCGVISPFGMRVRRQLGPRAVGAGAGSRVLAEKASSVTSHDVSGGSEPVPAPLELNGRRRSNTASTLGQTARQSVR